MNRRLGVASTNNRRPRTTGQVVRRVLAVPLGLAVLDYLVLPQLAGTTTALRLVGHLKPGWIVAAVALEAASLLAFSLLTQTVLSGDKPRYSWILRSDLTGLGISHVVPASGAAATTVRSRLLHEGGAPVDDTLVGIALQSVGSLVVLLVMLWVALVTSIPASGFPMACAVPATIASVVLTLLAMVTIGLAHDGSRAAVQELVRRLPTRVRGQVMQFLEGCAERLRQLLSDRRARRWFVAWAAVNWLLDAAALWVFLAAYGWRADPLGLMVGYALANLAAQVPISPGGLGVIEGILVPPLVAFGGPTAVVVLGVVSWRLGSCQVK